ncbi:Rhodanese- sulfurtransferase [Tulasnella sp. JGI-2019a]|nr:Rhodanese- sulfurtransferase [Tulasnella sp. JGI-2019a]KAG9000198.1 Rhodanese- sulfurtransferase [Tulasnella sp. JGI-2019a]
MDVSAVIAQQASDQAAKYKSVTVDKDIPLEPDVGLLTITDPNPIDQESYGTDLEAHLQSLARDGVQSLFTHIFALPTQSSIHGPLAILPKPTTKLPRTKPLPKPKPPTKWEIFAKAKGISHTNKDKKVWNEEKQEWSNRWGKDGKNKEFEQQWIHEVPKNAPHDFDPVLEARNKRKERITKNKTAQTRNAAYALAGDHPSTSRKEEVERTLARTKVSTASMGQFDRKLEGDKPPKGIKRKFEPAETTHDERDRSLAMIAKLDGRPVPKKVRTDPDSRKNGKKTADVLNVRKAIKNASKGGGSLTLAKATEQKERGVRPKAISKTQRKAGKGRR